MGWTDEELERLALLARGKGSAGEIANALGKTRNAVIGKLRRIGIALPGAVGPRAVLEPPVRKRARRPVEARQCSPLSDPGGTVEIPPGVNSAEPSVDLPVSPFRACQWYFGDPRSGDFSKCNKPCHRYSSFCEEHYRRVYTPVPPQRRTTR